MITKLAQILLALVASMIVGAGNWVSAHRRGVITALAIALLICVLTPFALFMGLAATFWAALQWGVVSTFTFLVVIGLVFLGTRALRRHDVAYGAFWLILAMLIALAAAGMISEEKPTLLIAPQTLIIVGIIIGTLILLSYLLPSENTATKATVTVKKEETTKKDTTVKERTVASTQTTFGSAIAWVVLAAILLPLLFFGGIVVWKKGWQYIATLDPPQPPPVIYQAPALPPPPAPIQVVVQGCQGASCFERSLTYEASWQQLNDEVRRATREVYSKKPITPQELK